MGVTILRERDIDIVWLISQAISSTLSLCLSYCREDARNTAEANHNDNRGWNSVVREEVDGIIPHEDMQI